MPEKGSYNFKKPIDKTVAKYEPMKVSFKKKVNLSELHKKDKKSYKVLGYLIAGWITVMVLIYVFALLMLKFM